MKKVLPILVLLLAGCEARESVEVNHSVDIQDNLLAGLENASIAEDPAKLQALIDRAMAAALPEGSAAHYRNLRFGVGGAACGEVAIAAGKQKPGLYRHFVITPDAVAVIGTNAGVKFNDPSDFLADAWIRWCASPEELKLVETQLDQDPALAPDPLPDADIPPAVEEPLLPMPRTAPPHRTASAEPLPPPPPARIDSFSKSVARQQ